MQVLNKVIISDPCYDRGTSCMIEQDNMLEGNYNYYIEESDEGDWGIRVKSIEIIHENYKRPSKWKLMKGYVGVDSGQAGIFCDSIYPLEETGEYGHVETFYGKCCELTTQNQDDVRIWWELKEDIENELKSFDMVNYHYEYYKENLESLSSLETYLEYNKKRFDEHEKLEKNRKSWEEYEKDFIERYKWNIESDWYKKRFDIYKNYLETGIMPIKPKLIQYGIIDNKGIVSRSGFGDGGYNWYASFNKSGKCIGVKIKYI